MKQKNPFFFVMIAVLTLAAVLPLQGARMSRFVWPSAVEPKAKDTLRQMSDYLSRLSSFKVRIQTTREVMFGSDLELDTDHSFDLTVRRPDRLYGVLRSAAGEKQFFYDGKTFTIYTPKLKYYASFAAPAALDGLFRETVKYGFEMPAADFIYAKPYQALTQGVKSGIYVGKSLIDGIICNHLAFKTKNLEWQVWIQNDDTPLPRKVVITDKLRPGRPRFMAVFSDWDVSPAVDESIFTFTPGEGDKKIDIRRMPLPRMKRVLRNSNGGQ